MGATGGVALEELSARDEDGAMYTPSLQIALYADKPLAELARGVTACHEVFVEAFGDNLKRYLAGSMRKVGRFSTSRHGVFARLCRQGGTGLPPYRVFNGSGLSDFIPPVFATGAYGTHSWLQAHLPLSLRDEWSELIRLLTAMARPIPFRSGTVGLSLCWNEMAVDRSNDVPRLIGPLLKRYGGLNIGTPREICDQGLPPVSWLTLLGPKLLRGQGGIAGLRRALSRAQGISVLPLGKGAMIRAGESPQLGDRNRRQGLPLYRKVGALLKHLRGEQEIELDGLTLAESKRWLGRFDT